MNINLPSDVNDKTTENSYKNTSTKAHSWDIYFTIAKLHPRIRNLELRLLGWVILGLFCYYYDLISVFHRQFNSEILIGPIYFIFFCLILHTLFRLCAPFADPVILPITLLLNGLGLIMLLRLDYDGLSTYESYGAQSTFAVRQLYWLGCSVAAAGFILLTRFNHRSLAKYIYSSGILGVFFLLLPSILPDKFSTLNGAHIWILTSSFSVQTSEIAKILLIIFFAGFLIRYKELFSYQGKIIFGIRFPHFSDCLPIFLASIISIIVFICEKDLGTALLIYITMLIMISVATENSMWFIIGIIIFLCEALLCYCIFPFERQQITTWLHPMANAHGSGYQSVQALLGLGTGGIAGTGLGYGRPTVVPFSFSDFMIASLGEELGQIGLCAILILYLILILRAIHTGTLIRDSFGKLLCCGIAALFFVQITLVTGGITHMLPLTSLTTPFISYGGSNLIASYILITILVRISSDAREPAGLIIDPGRTVAYSITEFLTRRKDIIH